ncbi:MAG: hypothetical protein V4637_14510, partial [Pseudomonadota bacterium]
SKAKEFDGVVLIEGAFTGQFFATNREPPPLERTPGLIGITRAKTGVTIVRPMESFPLVSGRLVQAPRRATGKSTAK